MAFKNLEERFNEKMAELYSQTNYPAKDSADLHPLIEVRPNSEAAQDDALSGTNREVPVEAVLRDQRRMTAWLTSPTGLRWFLKQGVLQTGNAISETRLLNPLFVNLNLTPQEHFKRQLLDQQDFPITSEDRSPASTPLIGRAGRLQFETAQSAKMALLSRPNLGDIISSIIKSNQLGQVLFGVVGAADGTLGVNERPEFNVVNGKDYYTIQYEGTNQIFEKQISLVSEALGFVGLGLATIGIPNLFKGLRVPASSPLRTAGDDDTQRIQSWMPYYASPGKTYLDPLFVGELDPFRTKLPLKSLNLIGPSREEFAKATSALADIANVVGDAFAFVGLPNPLSQANQAAQSALAAFEPTDDSEVRFEDRLSEVAKERSIKRYYEKAEPGTSGSAETVTDRRIQRLRDKRTSLQEAKNKWNQLRRTIIESGETPFNRGVWNGVTLQDTTAPTPSGSADDAPIAEIIDENTKNAFFASSVNRSEDGHARYYTDALNFAPFAIAQGVVGGERATFPNEAPDDYVKFQILDKMNNRLLAFRAIIETINEAHTPELTDTKYIGRIERNVVYTGNVRLLTVNFYVHAFSEAELEVMYRKMNHLTGLAYPARYSTRGYMIPPLIELTIGDFYNNQPGYLESLIVDVQDGTTWEIEEGKQVPHTLYVTMGYSVIEKETMSAASSGFYGFGAPTT